jgi:hypothetical protein
MRNRRATSVLVACLAALLGVQVASAQSGGVGGDPGARNVSVGPWSGEVSTSVVGGGSSFAGRDGVNVTIGSTGGESSGGSSAGTGTGAPVCVSSGLRLTEFIPLPDLTIESLPEDRGIVGTETYFRIKSDFEGDAFVSYVNAEYTRVRPVYDLAGNMVECQQQTVPLRLPVYFWPIGYQWTWGDGSEPLTPQSCRRTRRPTDCQSGLGLGGQFGLPHVYEVSSLGESESKFEVTLSVNFRVALRLGSTFLTLVPELLQTQTHDLRVEQIQSVLVD